MTRNEQIARQVEAGKLILSEIGKSYGLSRERVRQIAGKEKATPRKLQAQIEKVLPFSIELTIHNPWGLPKLCSEESRLEPSSRRGLCNRHYFRWAYHYLPGRKEYTARKSRGRRKKNPEKAREMDRSKDQRYRLRQAGLLPPVKREPVPKARASRGKP